MTDSNYIKVFTGNLIITERIIQSLKDSGINAVVREQNESGLDPKVYGGHLLQVILVHKDELDKAVSIIEEINSELQA
ncbi:putative signal transducing protein [Seonamhaeicola maritimus]|uniref:putative signal transducing protein n=1 Tax=Seonamhaeicola maritimus TaxID=2591822 RepID=UPI0024948E63|nr:DUF2007 domain-containing protein [Seonamhaeicola maritimus]